MLSSIESLGEDIRKSEITGLYFEIAAPSQSGIGSRQVFGGGGNRGRRYGGKDEGFCARQVCADVIRWIGRESRTKTRYRGRVSG